MKYVVSYKLPSQPEKQHSRYYDALNISTVLEMFSATCEESLAGESPLDVNVKEVSKAKKNLNKSSSVADIDSI